MTAPGEPTITALKLRNLDPSARIAGRDAGWLAPVGVFNAAYGFGEEWWLDAMPETVVAISLSGAPVTCWWGPRKGLSSSGGSPVALHTKGSRNYFSARGGSCFGQIYLPDRLIDRVAEGLGSSRPYHDRLRDDFAFQPELQFENLVRTYVGRVCSDSDPASTIEIEAWATLLVEYMLRRLHGLAPTRRAGERGGLAPWQLRRACDRMSDDLSREPGLAELAALVNLSPEHFCRAFRRSTGDPPHRWLAKRRMAQAQALLLDPDLSLTDIAQMIGYTGQSAFGAAFRRATGWKPSDWRRERMS